MPFRRRKVSPSSLAALTLGRPASACPGGRRRPGRRRQPGHARGSLHHLQALPAELPLRPVRQGHRRHPGVPGHGLRRPAARPPALRRVRLRPEGYGGGGRGGQGPLDRPVQLLRHSGPRDPRLGRMGPPHGYGPILYEELARPWTSDSKGRGSDAQSVGVPTPSPGPWAVRSGPRRRPDGPPGAAAPRKVITPRTFSPPRRPARAAEPRNHADSHRVRGCWPA